jgi:hypothetical protein
VRHDGQGDTQSATGRATTRARTANTQPVGVPRPTATRPAAGRRRPAAMSLPNILPASGCVSRATQPAPPAPLAGSEVLGWLPSSA